MRAHPLQIEFHMRNTADGFRVQRGMPKAAVMRPQRPHEAAEAVLVVVGMLSQDGLEGEKLHSPNLHFTLQS